MTAPLRPRWPLLLLLLLLLPPLPAAEAPAEAKVFPADAGLVDVTKPPYEARGDGVTDCTAAVQAAFNRHLGSNRTLYFPDGVYLFSDSVGIFNAVQHTKTRFVHLQGQSRKGTILRLKERSPGFADPAAPKVFFSLYHGGKTGDAMHTSARDVTIEIGAGNPGAAAFSYLANNSGCIYDLTIRSLDPAKAGAIGLDLRVGQQGPALVKRVEIDGFDRGVEVGDSFAMVFEHLVLRDQRQIGFLNGWGRVTIRGLAVHGAPIAVANRKSSHLTLVEARLSAGATGGTAIDSSNPLLFLRDIAVEGYGRTMRVPLPKEARRNPGKADGGPPPPTELVASGDLREWSAIPPRSLFAVDAPRSLRLPIEETPQVPWEPDPARWIRAPLAAEGGVEALQKAIDEGVAAGKTTLYFPKVDAESPYVIDRPVRIHGGIRRVIGMESIVRISAGPLLPVGSEIFIFEDLQGPCVFERFFNILVKDGWRGYREAKDVRYLFANRTRHPLIIANLAHGACQLKKPHPGTTWFLEDVVGEVDAGPGERIWVRQLNPESGRRPMAVVDGGQLWVLGLKTEGRATHIEAVNGAAVELLGGVSYQSWKNQPLDPPMFIIRDARMSMTLGFYHHLDPFGTIVQETVGGESRSLACTQVSPYHLPLYRSETP